MAPRSGIVFIALLLVMLSACDEERVIDPFEFETGTFSIYGAVELDSESNFIRIKNLQTPFFADPEIGYEDIQVSLMNTETDNFLAVEDSIREYLGIYTQNYLLLDDLEPRVKYTFSIQSENGQEVGADFTMPGVTVHSMNRTNVPNCYNEIRFAWDNVKAPEYILAEAGVNYMGRTFWGEVERVDEPDHVEGQDRMEMDLTVRQLLVDIFPPPIGGEGASSTPVEFWSPEVECFELDNNEIYIRYIHFGPEWEQFEETSYYFLDILDSDSVYNGVGFLGGLRRDGFSFTVDDLN